MADLERLSRLEQKHDDLISRVQALEIAHATIGESIRQSREHFDFRFDKLEGGISRGLWLFGGAIVIAIGKFVIEGGLIVG